MSGVELRSSNGELVLRGYATVFDVPYSVGGLFTEVMRRGCAKRSLKQETDCCLLIEHEGLPLARTRSPSGGIPTLKMREDEKGLWCEGQLDQRNPRVQELHSVSEHTGLGMSVGMEVNSDKWSKELTFREISAAIFSDVTACAFPANPATSMGIDERTSEYKSSLEQRQLLVTEMRGQKERRMCPALDVPILGEMRSNYSASELGELGAKGLAFADPSHGGWKFPTKTKSDFDSAVKMVQLAPASQQAAIRKYLMGRARAEKWKFPVNWASDGSARSSGLASYEQRWDEQALGLRASQAGVRPQRRSTGIAAHIEALNMRDQRELDRLRRR